MRFKLFGLFATTILAGCVSVLPEVETADALYRFGPMEASQQLDADVVIREPDASRVFGGRAIVSEGADGGLRLVPGVEWTDPATYMFQLGLLDALGDEGEGVALAAHEAGLQDYEVSWRVSDFSLNGTTARCQLALSVVDSETRTAVRQADLEGSAQALDGSASERALALVEAGRVCIRRAAELVAQTTRSTD